MESYSKYRVTQVTDSGERKVTRMSESELQKLRAKRLQKIDPLPAEFSSEEEAGEFWDTHSITDYEEYLGFVEFKADIKRRHFQVELDEESFLDLRSYSRKQQKPAKQLVSEVIKKSQS